MKETRVKISNVIENQLPQYIRNESPLLVDFLRQYYISVESKGQVLDILENIDEYVKVDNITNIKEDTVLTESVFLLDESISVESTLGFPDSYGLLKIDNEIISYEYKTKTEFVNCHRGFSGIESYDGSKFERNLIFKDTEISEHIQGSIVENISLSFLKIFLEKVKLQFTPGFEDRSFTKDLNQSTFIKHSKDFYSSKGTISSFEILFRALYGEDVSIIKPSDFLLSPSNNNFLITKDIVVEPLQGNPEELVNQTLYQDDDGYFSKSSATISKVEKFVRNSKPYYTLSLDFGYNRDNETEGSFIGDFSIHPKTIIIGNVNINQNYIDVDSTIGFPNSGNLVVNLNGINFFIPYKSKTINQFLECENISAPIPDSSEIRLNSYAYGFSSSDGNQVQVRIGGVLSELEIKDDTFLCGENDNIKIISPGIQLDDIRSKKWLYNIPLVYDANPKLVFNTQTNLGIHNGEITTIDEHNFYDNDDLTIIISNGTTFNTKVSSVLNKNSIVVNPPLPPRNTFISRSFTYKVKRNLLKSKFTNYPEIININSNVQNAYYDINDESIYVASPSIPNYFNRSLDLSDGSITFSGIQVNSTIRLDNHPFLSGDSIYYSYGDSDQNLPIEEDLYFVERVDANNIKIYRSREDLYLKKNVSFIDVSVSNNKIFFSDKFNKKLESQKLLRKFTNPINDGEENITPPGGYTGMLLNGVEILNYKSQDYVYYGGIENVEVISTLDNYDVINPPKVVIRDPNGIGVGASIILHIEGNLKKINIEDQGFDYLDTPKIKITGGNGIEAKVEAKLVSFKHIANFNSENLSVVNLNDYSITFFDDHKFRDIEEVIYNSNNQNQITGLVNDTIYFLKSVGSKKIKLYSSRDDAILGINTVGFTSTGSGIHSFISTQNKKKLGSISVINSGKNYKNKQVIVESTNINFRKNVIIAKNHGYKDGDVINYYSSGNNIGNVSNKNYLVKVISKNEFSLVDITENSNLQSNFNLNRNNIVDLKSSGTGVHYFNYPEINVSVEGIVGVNTYSSSSAIAKLQPIFKGKIENVYIFSSGERYGAENVINYQRQPIFDVLFGTGALLRPIILNGKIKSVSILNSGNNYTSPPDLKIVGKGFGAILTPIITNGKIVDVKVINEGTGYITNQTEINVISTDQRTILTAKIKSWNINNYYRFLNTSVISDRSSILSRPLNKNFGLQYSHLTLPNSIRKILKISKQSEDLLITISDFENDSLSPQERIHSPIIGWSYDGNPIYGPYGFDTPNGGVIRRMTSGYELKQLPNRPNYPNEFLVEDYVFSSKGDLDENNGRYCITPEYPNGVYAYFCTIDEDFNPVFPFIIGNRYKSSPIRFNFQTTSNQEEIDINTKDWVRNTYPYKILSENSDYPYIINPNSIKEQNSIVSSIRSGTLDSIDVQLSGDNYRVGEKITLESISGDFGIGASAEISEIIGKDVISIETEINSIDDVLFSKSNVFGNFIGISTVPHGLVSGNFVSICGCEIDDIITDDIFYEVKIEPTKLTLSSDIGNFNETGSIAFMNVNGNIKYPFVIEDDIFMIGNEKVKVLLVDIPNKRIKVLRGIDSTNIVEHSIGDSLIEIPRKIYLDLKVDKDFDINKKYYFNPSNTIGIGTVVGIGTTVSIDNPELGINEIFIPSRTIYLPEHGLKTGDKLTYNTNFGVGIQVSKDGINNFVLEDGSELFVSKISKDLIGISTDSVGLWEYGTYNTIENSDSILYFITFGEGINHSLTTNYDNIFKAEVNNIVTKLVTKDDHLLKVGDTIDLTLKSNKTITYTLLYDLNSRNLVFNKQKVTLVGLDSITLTIPNHGLLRGQKVIFNSFNPPLNVYDSEKFYIIVVDSNRVKLSKTYFGALNNQDIIKFNIDGVYTPNGGSYFLSLINPQINIYNNQTIIFDLEHDSLLGFDFNLYEDSYYRNVFYGISGFNVKKNGTPGNPNSNLVLDVYDTLPSRLYYNLSIPNKNISIDKLEFYVDNINIINNNSLILEESKFNSVHKIVGIGSTYVEFNLKVNPEDKNYINNINSNINYRTKSKNSLGPISKVKVTSKGRNYKKLPIIKKINSKLGSGAILDPKTNTIGKINSIEIVDIGFDYFSDKTLRPSSKIPEILKINPLTSLDYIQVISFGERYNTSPNLILIDGFTKKPVNDVLLDFNLKDRFVNIIKNTSGIYNVPPRLVPINNSNGIGIVSIQYFSASKEIRIILNETYSDIFKFPFSKVVTSTLNNVEIFTNKITVDDASKITESSLIKLISADGQIITNEVLYVKEKNNNTLTVERGYFDTEIPNTPFKYVSGSHVLLLEKNVLIENVNILTDTGEAYNSINYDFKLYPLKQIIPQIGGETPQIILDVSDFIPNNKKFGDFDAENSLGIVVPESYFPVFDIALKKNIFYIGEKVYSENSTGVVEYWDKENEQLRVRTNQKFDLNSIVVGESSLSKGTIVQKYDFKSYYKINSSSIVIKSWSDDYGFLNTDLQKIHDNFYYQYFSYSIKSRVPLNEWDNSVSLLNHTSGFKKFSELQVEIKDKGYSGIQTSQNDSRFSSSVNLTRTIDVNCKPDYDLVTENSILFNSTIVSDQIIFESKELVDYFNCIGNRVLKIDDISSQFRSTERLNVVNRFNL
jgi:hypothetical protein